MSSEAMNPDTVTITSIDESAADLATTGSGAGATATVNNTTTVPPVDLELPTNVFKASPTGSTTFSETSASSLLSNSSSSVPLLGGEEAIPGSSKDDVSSTTTKAEEEAEGEKKDDSMFECNICLDTAKDAVVSMCGHLFCWPCLHQWLETRPRRQVCPVCKASISKEKVIPLYGRGSTNQQDPRTKVPPRPAGQRTEPENTGFQGFGFNDGGFHMSFGIGAFPLGYLSSFNFDGRGRTRAERGTPHFEEEQFLSKVFIWVATIFLAWLVFVY